MIQNSHTVICSSTGSAAFNVPPVRFSRHTTHIALFCTLLDSWYWGMEISTFL